MGGNFKFQVQDSFLEYFFWRFAKQISLSEKKPPLGVKAPVAEYKMSTQPRDKSLESTFNAQCTFVCHFFIEKYLFIALSSNIFYEKNIATQWVKIPTFKRST